MQSFVVCYEGAADWHHFNLETVANLLSCVRRVYKSLGGEVRILHRKSIQTAERRRQANSRMEGLHGYVQAQRALKYSTKNSTVFPQRAQSHLSVRIATVDGVTNLSHKLGDRGKKLERVTPGCEVLLCWDIHRRESRAHKVFSV
jgi:hypothetical protein|eukprot:COSAG01_NODE_1201_length_11274_cov_639.212349_16_plen_145_part_00